MLRIIYQIGPIFTQFQLWGNMLRISPVIPPISRHYCPFSGEHAPDWQKKRHYLALNLTGFYGGHAPDYTTSFG